MQARPIIAEGHQGGILKVDAAARLAATKAAATPSANSRKPPCAPAVVVTDASATAASDLQSAIHARMPINDIMARALALRSTCVGVRPCARHTAQAQ